MPEIIRMLPKEFESGDGRGPLSGILEYMGDISDRDRDELNTAKVREMKFEPHTSTLTLVLENTKPLRDHQIVSIEKAAVSAVPGLIVKVEKWKQQALTFEQSPDPVSSDKPGSKTLQKKIDSLWGEIIEDIKEQIPAAGPMLYAVKPVVLEKEVKILCATQLAVSRLMSHAAHRVFEEVLYKKLKKKISISVEVGSFEPPPPPKKSFSKGEQEVNSGRSVLLGSPRITKRTPVAIETLDSVTRDVCIEGTLFGVELREVGRPVKEVLSFGITDYVDSIKVKMFVPPQKMKELVAGDYIRVSGSVYEDKFEYDELLLKPREAVKLKAPMRVDTAEEKRVELNLHTKFSRLNGLIEIDRLVDRVSKWGWKGFAVTDNAVVQAFPKAYKAAKAAGLKIGFGCQLNYCDDLKPIAWGFKKGTSASKLGIDQPAIVFDLETTGLSAMNCKVIEIAAYRVEGNRVVDEFESFVNVGGEKLSEVIKKITHINDDMLTDAPSWKKVFKEFQEFVGDAVLVAHNISFDAGFLRKDWAQSGKPMPILVDTLGLSRTMLRGIRNYTLGTVCKNMGISIVNAHRASDDARALTKVYIELMLKLKETETKTFRDLNLLSGEIDAKKVRPVGVTAMAKNRKGLESLNKIVTSSHLNHFYISPRIPASELEGLREGLLLGSGAADAPVVDAVISQEDPELIGKLAKKFDYLEIGPPGIYADKLEDGIFTCDEDIENFIREIILIGEDAGIPVVAVSNSHHLDEPTLKVRRVLRYTMDKKRADKIPSTHLRTTNEMLEEFAFLGEEKAK